MVKIFGMLFFMMVSLGINSQRILQLEILREVEAVKFYEGESIVFKSSEFSKDWQKKTIERIIVEDGIIIFTDGMVMLKDITQVRLENSAAQIGGKVLSGFGAGWFLFGTIAHFATENKLRWTDVAIGATAVVIGWVLTKFISKKTYKMGKNANLRLLDVSFPTPEEVLQPVLKP